MDKNNIIQKLKEIKPSLIEKYGVTELALFGSYSRDEQQPESDIDIMVGFGKIIGIQFVYLAEEIDELFPKMKVQIVSKKGIRPQYFEAIKSDLMYV